MGVYGQAGFEDEPPMHDLEVTRHVTRRVSSPGGNISHSKPGGDVNVALSGHSERFQRRTGRMIRRKKRA